jgi:hypothetical protein
MDEVKYLEEMLALTEKIGCLLQPETVEDIKGALAKARFRQVQRMNRLWIERMDMKFDCFCGR